MRGSARRGAHWNECFVVGCGGGAGEARPGRREARVRDTCREQGRGNVYRDRRRTRLAAAAARASTHNVGAHIRI